MITSFFKTSKPIHYIIFLIVLTFLFVYQRIIIVNYQGNLSNILKDVGYLLVLLASFFTLIFIVTKNNLTHNNGYAALYFCLFMGLIPSCLEVNSVLISNLFILLSLRRIVSLRTNSNIKKKVLDASMWICLAAIFEPWTILFLGGLFMAMVIYSAAQIKNTVILFCGVLAVGILLTCFQLLTENTFPNFNQYLPTISFDSFVFTNTILEIVPLLFIAVVLLGIVSFIAKGFLKNRLKTPNFFVLVLIISIGIAIVFLSSSQIESTPYFLFVLAPSAIILANFSETTKYLWLSELVIATLFVAVLFQAWPNIPFPLN